MVLIRCVKKELHCSSCAAWTVTELPTQTSIYKDVVYIRIQPEVENGEIAAVRIDGEATLKRVYYNPGTLTLMPANPAYAPMVYTGSQLEEVHIEGKAVGWTHWVG